MEFPTSCEFKYKFTSGVLTQPVSRKLIISLKETILTPTRLILFRKPGISEESLFSGFLLLSDLTKIQIHTKCIFVLCNTEL